MKINSRTGIIALLILGVLGLAGFVVINRDSTPSPDRKELPLQNQAGLEDDKNSINTIVYGIRDTSETRIYAVNDSGKNNTLITIISPDVKFITPLVNGKQIFYIANTNEGDIGGSFEIKTINSTDGGVEKIYTATDGYGIDRYIISENNEWMAWYEVKPEVDEYTHSSDYFRVYKANLGKVLSGQSDRLEPIFLSEIKGAPDVQLGVPSVISNNGELFTDGLIPNSYALHYGFKNEQGQEILPVNTYNSNPYSFSQNNLLYSSFDPNNAKLSPGEGASTREEILNTNSVKVININSRQITTVGPGDNGEQYKHPIYIDGSPGGKLSFVADVYKILGEGENQSLFPQEIQLVTKNSDGSFNKDRVFNTTDGKKYRILTVGEKPGGVKTVLVGEETSFRGNLGTGLGIGSSGYKNQILNIRIINLDSKAEDIIKSDVSSEFEFISLVLKTPDEKIGIDRDKVLAEEFAASTKQLQLNTFIPIEPKRERTNPRSQCEEEWKDKGYPNYEACEACPLYIYNKGVAEDIKIIPKTPISKNSAQPRLDDNSWKFTADKNGNLSFPEGNYSKIDYLFPRGKVSVPEEGILITQRNRDEKIADYAYSLGFNTREVKDIVYHFRKELGDFEYVFFSHLPESETIKLVDFEVSPEPQVFKNIMFYSKKYASLDEVEGFIIESFADKSFFRSEYTVIAWGSVME